MLSQANLDRKSIFHNILTLFFSSAVTQGVTAAILLLTARQVGPEQYGQYTSSMTLVTILSIFFSLGLNLWLLKQGGQDPQNIDSLTGSVILIKIAVGSFWLLAVFLVAPLIRKSTLPPNIVSLAAVAIFSSNLYSTIVTSFKALLRNTINAALEITSIGFQFIVTLGLLYIGSTDIFQYLGFRTLVIVIFAAFSLWYARKIINIKASRLTARAALTESPPFAATELLATLYMRVDLLIVAIRLDEFAAGVYSLSVGIINALFFIPNTVSFVLIPVLSNLFKAHLRQAWLTTRRSLLLFGSIGLALMLSIFPLADIIVRLLGHAYEKSALLLKIMSPIILLKSINYGLAAILVSSNQQGKRSFVQLLAVLFNIIMNWLVIAKTGIIGVALVYVLTEFLLLIGYSYLVYRVRTHPDYAAPSVV